MIALDQTKFAKAIEKARIVRPRVMHIGAHYGVKRSDQRNWAHVVFTVRDGRLWASCTCKAHTYGSFGNPVPCYHIAAAALSHNATSQAATPAPAPTPEPDHSHSHACPYCCEVYPCNCSNPEIDDVPCDHCGNQSVDWAETYRDYGKEAWV